MTWLICNYHATTGKSVPSSLFRALTMGSDTIGAAVRIWRKSNAYGFYYCNQLFKI